MIDYAKYTELLYSAVLSDTLDSLGFMNQAMKPFIRPVDDGLVTPAGKRRIARRKSLEVQAMDRLFTSEIIL